MKTRLVLYADKGKVLTNGEIYGKQMYLANGANIEEFYEITDGEYEAIQEKERLEALKEIGY